jgi:hypothetical protein
MIALLTSLAFAADPPPSPVWPKAGATECAAAISWPVHMGKLVGPPACSGILVPTSEAEYLVLRDAYASDLAALYKKDTTALEQQLQSKSDLSISDANKQRWIGRLEVLGAVAIGVSVAALLRD